METAVWGDCIQRVVRPLEWVCLLFSRITLPPATVITSPRSTLSLTSPLSSVFYYLTNSILLQDPRSPSFPLLLHIEEEVAEQCLESIIPSPLHLAQMDHSVASHFPIPDPNGPLQLHHQ